MKYNINDIHYYVETRGDGFPLVLLHGFTGDITTWTPFMGCWEKHSTVIAIDIIGHGKTDSPKSVERYKMMSVVDDLHLIFEKLNIHKADIVGYSMGGRLALSFTMKYPHLVRKLILESSSPGLKTEEERFARKIKDEQLANFIEEKGLEAFVDYWENIPLFASQKKLPKDVQTAIREQRRKGSPIGLANSLRGMGTGVQPSWWNELPALKVEGYILTGALDKKFCRIGEEMKRLWNGAILITFEDCGHAIHVEKSEEFGKIVSRFLSES